MGLITLTFDSVTLPEKVEIGYKVVFTRPKSLDPKAFTSQSHAGATNAFVTVAPHQFAKRIALKPNTRLKPNNAKENPIA